MNQSSATDVFVILPGGELESGVAHLVPDDVELIRLDPLFREATEECIGDPQKILHYIQCRNNGCSRKLAACLASRSFPGCKTDAVFNEGRFSGSDQFVHCPEKGAWLRAEAERHGINPAGMYYLSGLADFPGDPTAWVSSRGDVQRVAEAKNLTIRDGYVRCESHETEPLPDVQVADDIIDREVDNILDENPGARREDVRERVYALRSGSEDHNPLLVNDYTEADIANFG